MAQATAAVDNQPGPDAPVSDIDPFDAAFLADPYPFHHALREAGPVVRLERHGIWAMARYAEVNASLMDWQSFSSAAGVGIDDFRKTRPWRPPSILLEVDPPLHTRTRSVKARVMSQAAVRRLREGFAADAETLVNRLVERGRFDAVRDLGEVFPLKVFPDAVGLAAEGRENLLPFSDMVFNSFGPQNDLFKASTAHARPVVEWIYAQCARDVLSPDGFGADIYRAMDAGEITEDEAPVLVRSMLTAGLDTTVNGIGNAVLAFAQNPDQWRLLREDPALVRPAFDEVLRWESPVQTFFRTTTRPVDVAGTRIGEGEKVLLFLASANRDPRKWPDPERFDIRRRPIGHVALGTGIHACVGQLIARLEAEVLFAALARRIRAFEIDGEPRRRLNNTVRGLASLPVRVRPAAR